MSVGVLKIDREYIAPEHHDGKWIDEPKTSSLGFHFDPTDVKFTVNTKWKESDTANDLQIPWEHSQDSDADASRITLTLRFDDRVSEGPGVSPGRNAAGWPIAPSGGERVEWQSAQRSAEILEAWATPISQPVVQILARTYEEEITPAFGGRDWPSGQSINFLAMGVFGIPQGAGVISARGDPFIQAQKDAAYSRENMKRVRTSAVGGTKMSSGTGHAPRPLLLFLFTEVPIRCVVTELELRIIAIDVSSGNPLSIEALVTLEEHSEEPRTGLREDMSKTPLEEYKTLQEWTRAVEAGVIKQTLEPRWQYKPGAPVTGNKWG